MSGRRNDEAAARERRLLDLEPDTLEAARARRAGRPTWPAADNLGGMSGEEVLNLIKAIDIAARAEGVRLGRQAKHRETIDWLRERPRWPNAGSQLADELEAGGR